MLQNSCYCYNDTNPVRLFTNFNKCFMRIVFYKLLHYFTDKMLIFWFNTRLNQGWGVGVGSLPIFGGSKSRVGEKNHTNFRLPTP